MHARSRALLACGALATLFTGFSWRLVHVQVHDHIHYLSEAAKLHKGEVVIAAQRGMITDCKGQPLAQNEPISTVVADPSLVKDVDATARVLARVLDLPVDEVRRCLTATRQGSDKPMQYVRVKRRVTEEVKLELERVLEEQKLKGIHFEREISRIYPNGSLGCHVIGFNNGNAGIGGIEQQFNSVLAGTDGYRQIAVDGKRRELPQYRSFERPPQDGHNIRLTIDLGVQNIVERELDEACRLYRPKGATVILMKPQTGEIIAMANRPHFDLNDRNRGTDEQRWNRAISSIYEPGSTFKVVTVTGALNRRLVGLDSYIHCENGYYSKYRLKDHHAYGSIPIREVVSRSSNIGVAKLALQMGDQNFYDCVRDFGFGEPTGISLPAEASGTVHMPHTWDKLTATRMAMGHAVDVTPLQVASAVSVIANGGKLMMPQIVKEITDDKGMTVSTFPPQEVRVVCRESTARSMRDALMDVCTPKGTAAAARVFGYKVAGKTGTAQKPDGKGGYLREKWVVSFAGFMPAENPAFVAVVVFDEARTKAGENYGGLVAAPVFARIAKEVAAYLGLEVTETRMQGESTGVVAKQGKGWNAQ